MKLGGHGEVGVDLREARGRSGSKFDQNAIENSHNSINNLKIIFKCKEARRGCTECTEAGGPC